MNQGSEKYFLYVRKSSESEDRQVLSIDAQIKELKELAQKRGFGISRIFTESKSAKAPGRPVFNEMMQLISKGNASGILAWKLDRLSRNPIDSGQLSWLLQQGVLKSIKTTEREYLPNDNVLLFNVETGMANQFLLDLSKVVKRGLKVKAEMGWLPGVAPLGYKNTKLAERGKNTLVRDSERWDLVRKIWEMVLTGLYTPPQVLELSKGWGLHMRLTRARPIRPIARATIYKILANPFYCGWFYYKGERYQGKHEPMITEQEFWRVQELLGRKGMPRPRDTRIPYRFKYVGLIKCGNCGASITAEKRTKHQKNGNTHNYIYYHCTKGKLPRCPEPCTEEKRIEEQLIQIVDSINISSKLLEWALAVLEREAGRLQDQQRQITKIQQSQLATVEKKISGLISMRAAEDISETEFKTMKQALVEERDKLQGEIKRAEVGPDNAIDRVRSTLQIACDAGTKFRNADPDEQRKLIAALTMDSNLLLSQHHLYFSPQNKFLKIKEALVGAPSIRKAFEPVGTRVPRGSKALPNTATYFLRGRRDLNP